MASKVPAAAMAYYVGLGERRSYAAVAEQFGVSKTAVANRAKAENWKAAARQAEAHARTIAVQKGTETLEEASMRHLKIVKAIQGKAIEALRAMPLNSAMEAVRALEKAIAQERLILGEPTERSAVTVEEVIKREYERWMISDGGPGRDDDVVA